VAPPSTLLARMRLAVVGHVEWVTFARVERLPGAGEIITAAESWDEAAGGGAVAAVELSRMGADVDFVCALGADALGEHARARLQELGVRVHAVMRPRPQRRAFTLVDARAERTIVVLGDRLVPSGGDALPWEVLDGAAGCYFTGGDSGALRVARRAGALVATSRAADAILPAGVRLDALVRSARDPGERLDTGALRPAPAAVVETMGADGGRWTAGARAGTWAAAPLPGPPVDAYGCGDCFAAGVTFGLAAGRDVGAAARLGAERGAACLTRHGPYGRRPDPLDG
jgi:ribokinase